MRAAAPSIAAQTATRLNVGCGQFKKPGFLNVDFNENFDPDMVVDLSVLPLPFRNDQFELIEADHVLEHLNEPFETMSELHRILRPGGRLVVRVPHFSRGFTHSDHRRGFDVTFAYYFRPEFTAGYTGSEFILDRTRLTWFAQPYLKRLVLPSALYWGGRATGAAIDLVANLSPTICSRLWCFWVGGFEQLEFVFRKPDATEA
jgi:SAM-dependent methyltransferase